MLESATKDLRIETKKTNTSPAFTGDIDPIEVLQTIDDFCEQLTNNPTDTVIQAIHKQLKEWTIITFDDNRQSYWLCGPMTIEQTTFRRTMTQRIAHLVQSRGEWKGQHVNNHTMTVPFRADIPFQLSIAEQTYRNIESGKTHALLVPLIHIHSVIQRMLTQGATSAGIFDTTHAVINMNRLRGWVEENEQIGAWAVKESFIITDILTLVRTAQVIIDTNA